MSDPYKSLDIEDCYTLVKDAPSPDPKHYDTHGEACAENPENHVWAVVEGEEAENPEDTVFGVLPGRHIVNVLYYLATTEPWDPNDNAQYTY